MQLKFFFIKTYIILVDYLMNHDSIHFDYVKQMF